MIDNLSWRAFLERWSSEAISVGLQLPEDAVRAGWLGRPPATAAQVAAAEARLDAPLPPSLRQFYSITNGWPTTSFDFGAIVPVEHLQRYTVADPGGFAIWSEAGDDSDPDGWNAILRRSVLVSDGTDQSLLDAGRPGPEWPSLGLTSWYPGLSEYQPNFRLGLQGHYASFVRFDAPDSVTHDAVRDGVESAYRRLLAGDPDAEADLVPAPKYGSDRASILLEQVNALRSPYRAGLSLQSYDASYVLDAAFVEDLWPMFVSSGLDPRDRYQESNVERVLAHAPAATADLVRQLVERYRRDGGLRADYPAPFGTAVEDVRALVRAGRDDDAWAAYLAALPLWRPASPLHVAPMAPVWDADLRTLLTYERGLHLLATPRG